MESHETWMRRGEGLRGEGGGWEKHETRQKMKSVKIGSDSSSDRRKIKPPRKEEGDLVKREGGKKRKTDDSY